MVFIISRSYGTVAQRAADAEAIHTNSYDLCIRTLQRAYYASALVYFAVHRTLTIPVRGFCYVNPAVMQVTDLEAADAGEQHVAA